MSNDQKVTLGQLRDFGSRRLQLFCRDAKCAHSIEIDSDCWPGSLRLADLESMFVCPACNHRGAEVGPFLQRQKAC
jgi:hypothetical protein